jgi:protein-L-isoaspartate(D-aspartate) O-methyltransferase
MDRQTELAIVRRAYTKQIMAAAGVSDRRVEAAFAAVRSEAFLGPGP